MLCCYLRSAARGQVGVVALVERLAQQPDHDEGDGDVDEEDHEGLAEFAIENQLDALSKTGRGGGAAPPRCLDATQSYCFPIKTRNFDRRVSGPAWIAMPPGPPVSKSSSSCSHPVDGNDEHLDQHHHDGEGKYHHRHGHQPGPLHFQIAA